MFYDLDILEGLIATIRCIESNLTDDGRQHEDCADHCGEAGGNDGVIEVCSSSSVIIIAQKIREFSSTASASEYNHKILSIFSKYGFTSSIVHSEGSVLLWKLC